MRLFTGFRSRLGQSLGESYSVGQGESPNTESFPKTVMDNWPNHAVHRVTSHTSETSDALQEDRQIEAEINKLRSAKANPKKWVPYGPSSLISLEDEITALEEHTADRHQQKQSLLQQALAVEKEISAACQRIKDLRQLHTRVREDETHEVQSLDTLQARIGSLEQTRQNLHAEHLEALNELQTRQEEIAHLREQCQKCEAEYAELQHEPARLRALIKERNAETEALSNQIKERTNQLVSQRQQLLVITQEHQKLEERLRVRAAEVQALQAQRREVRYRVHSLRASLEESNPSVGREKKRSSSELERRKFENRLLVLSLIGIFLILMYLIAFRH